MLHLFCLQPILANSVSQKGKPQVELGAEECTGKDAMGLVMRYLCCMHLLLKPKDLGVKTRNFALCGILALLHMHCDNQHKLPIHLLAGFGTKERLSCPAFPLLKANPLQCVICTISSTDLGCMAFVLH